MEEIKQILNVVFDMAFFLNEYCKMNPNRIEEINRISTLSAYLFDNVDKLKYLIEKK